MVSVKKTRNNLNNSTYKVDFKTRQEMLKKSSVQAATNYSIKMEMSSVSRSAVNGICWSCGLGRECSKNWWLQVRAIAPDRLTPVQVNLEERTGLAGRRTALPCLLFYLVPDTSCCQWLPVSWFTPRQMASGMWNLTLCLERNVVGLLNSGEVRLSLYPTRCPHHGYNRSKQTRTRTS